MSESIKITVKLFASYQEVYGVPELLLELPQGTEVVAVMERLIAEKPQLEHLRALTRFGVNLQFVEAATVLHDRDEVVLIPPVSGG